MPYQIEEGWMCVYYPEHTRLRKFRWNGAGESVEFACDRFLLGEELCWC